MTILDRYVLKQFVSSVAFALMALCAIFIVIDLLEHLGNFLDHKIPLQTLGMYYLAMLPYLCEVLDPVALMLGGLFAVGRLSSGSEITAMRSSGQHPLRFLMPFLVVALLASGAQLYFNGWVAPRAATLRLDIEREYLGSTEGRSSLNDLHFRESPSRNISMRRYDAEARIAFGVSIEEFGSAAQPRLQWRIDADTMRWDDAQKRWVLPTGLRRTRLTDHVEVETIRNQPVEFSVRHDQIVQLQLNTDEMTFTELAQNIGTLHKGGKDTRRQEIDLSGQWAFPFVNLVVIMISIPFAAVRRRGGMAVNIAAAMILAITYIAFTKVSQAVGAVIDVPVDVVGWGANVIFALVGVIVVFRTRF
jgi:lipopolysaccharide export system permease protein